MTKKRRIHPARMTSMAMQDLEPGILEAGTQGFLRQAEDEAGSLVWFCQPQGICPKAQDKPAAIGTSSEVAESKAPDVMSQIVYTTTRKVKKGGGMTGKKI